ncbi:MAG: adenylate/guanylate cyclase domain-containing protein [Desulfobaccales bacterium]
MKAEVPPPGLSGPARARSISRRTSWLLVAGVTMAVIFLALFRPQITEFIELKLVDLKFLYRGAVPAGPELAIVAIDDESLASLGRWPWSREVFSRFMQRLKATQPKVIGLDIIFAEKSDNAVAASMERLQQKLSRRGKGYEDLLALLQEEKQAADVDRRLAEEISEGSPTVLGFYFKKVGVTVLSAEPPQDLDTAVIQVSTFNLVRRLGQKAKQLPIIGAAGVEVNLPAIAGAAAGGGYFNMIPDPDGTVRSYPLAVAYGPYVFAPLSLVTLQHFLDNQPLGIAVSHFGVKEIRLGRDLIPVDRYGRMLINYLGPPGSFPTYSARAVVEGKIPAEALKDKVVLVGATAVGVYDMRVTPFSGIFPGIEIQATIIDNVLRRNFLQPTPYAPLPGLILIVALGVLLGLILPRVSAIWVFMIGFLLLAGFIVVNYAIFRYLGVNIDLFYPMLQIILVTAGINLQSFLAEEKARASLKKAFQSYVAPSVVEEIIKHPERLRLGGERRELTIFFCDIRGFTNLSESLAPEALAAILHDFLNPMSKIVVKHGGTIDKFMGDAIMALYGAPLHFPDHARRACETAVEMVETLKILDQEWVAQGRPPLRIGIGINSGPVAVGNMGSDTLFDYTAIGDNVNLASRLEGLNKYYGTDIIVSGSTAESLDNHFVLRELDLVRVKGKKQQVTIFELLGTGPPEPDLERFVQLYHQGLVALRNRQWDEGLSAFSAALRLRPQDQHCHRYLELAEQYQAEPPGPEWQGLSIMKDK